MDFEKILRDKVGPEEYARIQRDRDYLKKERTNYQSLSPDDLIVSALHVAHNFAYGNGKVNGFGPADCVYDAALVYRIFPEILIRLIEDSPKFRELVAPLREGKEVKCPCEGCTGYVRLM